jgi:hypothetical protein
MHLVHPSSVKPVFEAVTFAIIFTNAWLISGFMFVVHFNIPAGPVDLVILGTGMFKSLRVPCFYSWRL